MEKSLLIAGYGGQGVQTLGKLLAYTAIEDDLFVTYYPSYGAEMRGGTSNCTVVFSDREIAAPYRNAVDCVIALNYPSYVAFAGSVQAGGTLIQNSNLAAERSSRSEIQSVLLPLNDLAQEIGSPMVLNIIMLGFLSEFLGGVSTDAARNIVLKKLGKRENMLETNLKAFEKGVELAKRYK